MEELDLEQNLETPIVEEITVDPLAEVQAELAQVKDQFLRAKAETENIRKRSQEDVARAHKFAIERFAEGLIPVADSLRAALDHATDDAKEGLEITLKQLISAFEKSQLVEINPKVGDQFDPKSHQAVSMVESEQDENTIVTVLQRGYLLADRVLRPAMVTVSKAKEEQNV
jgi:molecular chaperone GrpE